MIIRYSEASPTLPHAWRNCPFSRYRPARWSAAKRAACLAFSLPVSLYAATQERLNKNPIS